MTNAHRVLGGAVFAAVMLASAPCAKASVIWDYSPSTTGGDQFCCWANQGFQHFGETVSFASGATVNGFGIYTGSFGGLGQQTTVNVWADSGGTPGLLLFSVPTFVSAIDTDGCVGGDCSRHFASFPDIVLAANTTYWIGMQGTFSELGQIGLRNPGAPDDSRMAQFSFGAFQFMTDPSVGDQAFRLYGDADVAPIPEPGTMILIGSGLLGLAARRRMRG